MPSLIDEKTRMPLGLVLGVVVGLLSIAATAATAHYRLGAVEEQQEAQDTKIEQLRDRDHDSDKRMQRVEDKLDSVGQSLRRIERKLFSDER